MVKAYYYQSEDDKKARRNPIILTLDMEGHITTVTEVQHGIRGSVEKITSPITLKQYVEDNQLIEGPNTSVSLFSSSAKGGKRSKKQRKSVRKLRRKTASRRK